MMQELEAALNNAIPALMEFASRGGSVEEPVAESVGVSESGTDGSRGPGVVLFDGVAPGVASRRLEIMVGGSVALAQPRRHRRAEHQMGT